MKPWKIISCGLFAVMMTASPVHAQDNQDGNNIVMGIGGGEAYLVYGNMVMATCNSSQTVSDVNVSVTNGNISSVTANQNGSTFTTSTGMAVGSGVVQISNSASATAIGGNYQ